VIRGAFNSQVEPPAPLVPITLGDPLGGAEVLDIPAQIDTAADRTLVPSALLQALGLQPVDEFLIGGVGGIRQLMPLYVVSLAIRSLPPVTIRALAHPGEPWVLLGRES
jgi:hypothetical protein